MRMRILLPSEIFLEEEVSKINAEAENGAFCLLEHHVDFATVLVPGLLSFVADGREEFVAVDAGTVFALVIVQETDRVQPQIRIRLDLAQDHAASAAGSHDCDPAGFAVGLRVVPTL